MTVLWILGVVFTLLFTVLYLGGYQKYKPMLDAVDRDFYPLADCFIVGIATVEKFQLHQKIRSNKKIQKLAEAFSREFLEFNYMINLSSKISYVLLVLPFAFFFSALAGEPILLLIGAVLAVLLPVYVDMKLDTIINEKREEIQLDFPNVLSKLALLVNAGMILRDAWKVVGESGTRKIYVEMQKATYNIGIGYSEIRAYEEFADACKLNEIKKFVSILCQNIEKGGDEIVHVIKELSVEAWNDKKRIAKQRGDAASTKLIIPVMIMFGGILMMIMVPIMAGMSF